MKVSDIIPRAKKDKPSFDTLMCWLEGAEPERDLIKVENLRMGDTFWYTLVGGKRRPWVTLWVRKGIIGAASLTHTDMEGGWPCEDRMWGEGCYIGPTLITVEEQRVNGSVYFPYTNLKHLKQIKDNIKKNWG